MTLLRRVFLSRVGPDVGAAAVVQPVMTGVGVFAFLAGVLYLPTLGPTRVETFLFLILLALLALTCHAVGQLAAIAERLDR
jgi:formate hydrogenlyase subunit 3/multisubunit Na+/H+ antiporter MnhD subunit